jgi:hypothetical protein
LAAAGGMVDPGAYNVSMRTAEDFVDDMLSRKNHWTAILSVARVARGGSWAIKAKQILRDRKLIPDDDDSLNKLRDAKLVEDKKKNEKRIKAEIEIRRKETLVRKEKERRKG